MPEAIAKELEPAVLIADAFALRRAGIISLLGEWAEMHTVSLWEIELPEIGDDTKDLPSCSLCVLSLGSLSVIDSDVVEWLSIAKARYPEAPLVILSDRTEPVEALHALKQGAHGFVPTSMAPDLAMQALSFIMSGGTFFPPEALTVDAAGRPKRGSASGRRRTDGGSEPNGLDTTDIADLYENLNDDALFRQMWATMSRSVIWPDFRPDRASAYPEADDASPSATILRFRSRAAEPTDFIGPSAMTEDV